MGVQTNTKQEPCACDSPLFLFFFFDIMDNGITNMLFRLSLTLASALLLNSVS